MNKPLAIGVGVLVLVMLLLFSTTYTVKYNQVAIKSTFGQTSADSVVRDAGLHFRLPVFIDKVRALDTRLQLVESPHETFETADGLQLVARAFLLWRVETEDSGPLDFFKSYGEIERAAGTLQSQFETVFTGALGEFAFGDLIGERSRLDEVEEHVRAKLATALAGTGVTPVTVGISRIQLPAKTSAAVLRRMQATRDVLAEAERNAGTAEAERIRSEGNTQAEKIRAFASQRAEEIRAKGEHERAQYLEQMGEDEDLAIFLVWLDTLERALSQNATVFIPAADFRPFHLLDPEDVVFRNWIPFPASEAPAAPVGTAATGGGAGGS